MNNADQTLSDTANYFERMLRVDETRLEFAGLLQNGQTPSLVRILNNIHGAELVIVVRAAPGA